MIEKFTVGVIVSNHFGVLNRVAGLYAKRGYNIDSLAVGETENPEYSRITIVSTGDEYMKTQVVRQLQKLHDVKAVSLLTRDGSVSGEHLLIKIRVGEGQHPQISALINGYGGNVLDFGDSFLTAEITGSSEQLDALIDQAREHGILEVCRSGAIALSRGNENIMQVQN